MNFTCPRCDEPLRRLQSPLVAFDACHTCGGIWLEKVATDTLLADDALETLTLVEHIGDRSQSQADTTTSDLPCPACSHPMAVVPIPAANVNVDQCQPHGWWFDKNELRAVVAALSPQAGAAPTTTSLVPPVQGSGKRNAAVAGGVAGAAVGAALLAGAGHDDESEQMDIAEAVVDGGEVALDGVELALEGAELVGDAAESSEAIAGAAEVAGTVAEAGAGALEGAGEILVSVLEVLGAIGDGF